MKLIYERKTLVKAIPLMALMAAINIIIAALSTLSVIVSVFLILFLEIYLDIIKFINTETIPTRVHNNAYLIITNK